MASRLKLLVLTFMLVWLGVMVWFLADFANEIETVLSAYHRKLLL